MQAFLNANSNIANDEAGLNRILRHLRKRVMLRLVAVIWGDWPILPKL